MVSFRERTVRILLVDDHSIVRLGLQMLIQQCRGLEVVGMAGQTTSALVLAAQEQPDIIILDLQLGGESGLDLIPKLHAVAQRSRILVLTGVADAQQHYQSTLR